MIPVCIRSEACSAYCHEYVLFVSLQIKWRECRRKSLITSFHCACVCRTSFHSISSTQAKANRRTAVSSRPTSENTIFGILLLIPARHIHQDPGLVCCFVLILLLFLLNGFMLLLIVVALWMASCDASSYLSTLWLFSSFFYLSRSFPLPSPSLSSQQNKSDCN